MCRSFRAASLIAKVTKLSLSNYMHSHPGKAYTFQRPPGKGEAKPPYLDERSTIACSRWACVSGRRSGWLGVEEAASCCTAAGLTAGVFFDLAHALGWLNRQRDLPLTEIAREKLAARSRDSD